MLNSHWASELYRFVLILLVAALVGWIFDLTGWSLALAASGYALWSLFQLHRLQRWLASGAGNEPPEAKGLWGEVLDGLYRLQQRDRKERGRLRAMVSYLRESFSSLPYGAVMLDADGNIEWSNSAAQQLLGLRYPEDSGQHLLNLLRAPEFVAYFEGESYARPLDMPSPYRPGAHLQIHVTFFGQRSRLLFVRDVTQTHKLESMRRDFVANVSHELRTPLTVINGYLETFADTVGDTNPRWARAIDQMLVQARRMQSLIKDLLLLSRLETVARDDVRELVALAPMLAAIRDEALAAASGPRTITIECDAGLQLLGRSEELRSAFGNLVFNAVRYTHPGGRIVLRWYADCEHAFLQVEDDGIGIDPEHIPRLTERFYRVDKSRSMDTGGTGLGLAIVKHVLLRHNARLVINSEPGKGSCFTCVFPIEQTARPALSA
jgi:two-component system phosphate regulon sensor histidine kinase PhoR